MIAEKNPEFYTIKTERLTLKLVAENTIAERFRILNENSEITKYLIFPAPKNESDTRDHFISLYEGFKNGKKVAWNIFENSAKKLIGTISLESIIRSMQGYRKNQAEIGYWLDPAFSGKGLMTEAAQAVVNFGFEALKLHKIIAKHFAENMASKRVIEKCGFRMIGTLRENIFKNGVWYDDCMYELLESEWKKNKLF